ncbi:hypothetical protein [Levilactobacillus sp. HBUAS70063]|uniref:hypothetical protein n=1 Tax=Levilactobacillus sp. HBUAS70063 TaxID=3109359 RepID=UPI0031330805
MKKMFSLGLVILLLGVGLLMLPRLTPNHSQASTPTTASSTRKRPTPKLTVSELKHQRKLTYSAIIYFAIKHAKLQRWQEVSDFKLGWQVENYQRNGQTKSLVWPDQHIQDNAKNLAPNWFRLTDQHVLYDSMIVHSFRQDQTKTTTLSEIVKQINADHAAAKVRAMPENMTVITHRAT